MRLVLDTNVVVSALLTPHGTSAQLLDMVLAGHLSLVACPAILAEYAEILSRPRFAFVPEQVTLLLDTLDAMALHVTPLPWPHPLPDLDDEPFLAAASAGQATLVTGNERHYPQVMREDVLVINPRQAVEQLRTASPSRLQESLPQDYLPPPQAPHSPL